MKLTKSYFLTFVLIASTAWAPLSFAEKASYDETKLFPGNDKRHLTEAGKYRLQFDNDLLVNSDNGFSNAWSFQLHTPVADSWGEVDGFADYLKTIAAWLPGMTDDGLKYRMSFSLSQLIQTPDDLDTRDPIPNDVPYAGLLTGQFGFIAYNDDEFRGMALVLGVVGRPSMAEQFQNIVHHTTGTADIAQGWDNQLKTEPLINVTFMGKRKFYRAGKPANFSFDASINGDIELGNMVTAAGVRLETRFGSNMPGGFAPYPDPIGRTMSYDASLAPAKTKESSIYGTVGLDVTAIAHVITIDGNVIRDNPEFVSDLEKEEFVSHVSLGFHYEKPTWGFHFQHVIGSDAIKSSSATATDDPDNTFSSIMFEWRI